LPTIKPKASTIKNVIFDLGGVAVGSVIAYLTFHKQLRRDRYAGTAHMLMFYGFFILFIGTCLVAAEDYGQKLMKVEHLFFYGRFYLVASLVLRCDDCVTYHVVRCKEEGVSRAEVFETLSVGLVVGGSITIPHLRRAVARWSELEGKT
jgi:AhpD family alkylhydroperoxidase